MITQANKEVMDPMNLNVGTKMKRIKDFTRTNPPEFHGSKVDEDLQEFINKVYKIVGIMGLSTVEKEKLVTHQRKDIAQVWFEQWKSEKVVDVDPLDWKKFNGGFLDCFFYLLTREANLFEFINI
ncbi:hypothetical protein MTR67_011708 [Solanum verrucosum]|uniref:Gag-pol polyprotein n=1 Tax=Solanum verrucosum TaxID=315347 RepID=A0AAF0TJG5_SOLVR|nr:hypothetical protein MTR67_011708 [Solanum verrucosum]